MFRSAITLIGPSAGPHSIQLRAASGSNDSMATFEDRQKGFEQKYKHDKELQFKINARRNKLLGVWAAKELGMPPNTVYVAKSRVLKRLREEVLALAEDIPHLIPG